MSEEEATPVVVDVTVSVKRLESVIENEIKQRIQHFVVKSLEQVVLDLAKSELRKVVGETLREVLAEGKVFTRPKCAYKEEWPDGPPPAELTLKEYVTLWLTQKKEFSWGNRSRLGEMLDRHFFQTADETLRHVLEEHVGELKDGLTTKLGSIVADKLIKKLGVD